MVEAGEPAPDFETRDSEGNLFRLSSYRGEKVVVLYFFPKCFTPGCDLEARGFREQFPTFEGSHAQVVGVSADDAETARSFRQHFQLPFPVLPDPERRVIELYGVKGLLGLAKRTTFLIGLDGKVVEKVSSMRPAPHIEQTLRRLKGSDGR